jgi:DNA replication protein DnaC
MQDNPFASWTPPRLASVEDLEREGREGERRAERFARTLMSEFDRRLPPSHRWASFDSQHLAERCADRAASARGRANIRERLVMITGPAGVGKTTLGVAMLRAAFELWMKNCKAKWATYTDDPPMPRLPSMVHAHRLGSVRIQTAAGNGEAPYVAAAIRAPLVLIDDVGAEKATQMNALPDVVRERALAQRPTWFTTGLTFDQMAQRYDDGIARRLFEGAVEIDVKAGTR